MKRRGGEKKKGGAHFLSASSLLTVTLPVDVSKNSSFLSYEVKNQLQQGEELLYPLC